MNFLETAAELPLPPHYDPERVGEIWSVPYEQRAAAALEWAQTHAILPAARDSFKTALLIIDAQNTFCIPGFELFVGGRSGMGAVEDNRRLCEFIYRNLSQLTHITATLDTHQAMQIFHALLLVDEQGRHPAPQARCSGISGSNGVHLTNPCRTRDAGEHNANPFPPATHSKEYKDEYCG